MKKHLLIFSAIIIFTSASFCEEQKSITVIDFNTSNVSEQEMNLIVDLLSTKINVFKNYAVIDRNMRDSVLAVSSFTNNDCIDLTCAIEIGKLISADEVITGSLGSVGNRYILTMKLVDVNKIEILKDTSGVFESIDELVDNCSLLAADLLSQETFQTASGNIEEPIDTTQTYVKRYYWGEEEDRVQLNKTMYNRAKRNKYTRIGMWGCYSLGAVCTAADIGIFLLAGGNLSDLTSYEIVLMSYGITYGLLGYIGGAVLQWGLEDIYDIDGNLTDF